MLGFSSRRQARTALPPQPIGRVHVEAAVVADPDTANIQRMRAINLNIGKGLQGYAGTVVGYDRGDPAVSLTTVMPGGNMPTAALAQVGRIADQAPPATIQDIAMSDPSLDPYQSLLWQRISR